MYKQVWVIYIFNKYPKNDSHATNLWTTVSVILVILGTKIVTVIGKSPETWRLWQREQLSFSLDPIYGSHHLVSGMLRLKLNLYLCFRQSYILLLFKTNNSAVRAIRLKPIGYYFSMLLRKAYFVLLGIICISVLGKLIVMEMKHWCGLWGMW